MLLSHLLPIAPWLRTSLSVIFLIAVLIRFVAWAPLVLAYGVENWRRFGETVRRAP